MKVLLLKTGRNENKGGMIVDFNSLSLYPPLGLLYIGASLESHGHEVDIIDLSVEKYAIEHIKKELNSSDTVGFSVYFDTYNEVAAIARDIKEIDPNIPMIIGGPHCSINPENALIDNPYADIAVLGEGEKVIIDIVRYLQGKKKISEISGILYRKNNQIKKGKEYKIIDNLDTLPVPSRDLVEKYDYGNFPWGYTFNKKFTSLLSSRGCPYHCRFCTRFGNTLKGYGYRQRSAENVVKEILEMDPKYRSIMIVDDNFLVDTKRAHKIFDILLTEEREFDYYVMGARVDTYDPGLYKKMKKAGVKLIGYGIESGNQDVLDYYNKEITLDQISNTLNLANDMNFTTFGTFILGASIETKQHFENTINFAKSLPLDIALFDILYYERGSDLWREAYNHNLISDEEYIVPADSSRNLGNFSKQELNLYAIKAMKEFYMRPQFILRQMYKTLSQRNINMLIKGVRFFTSLNRTY